MIDRGYLTEADFEVIFNKIKPHAKVVQLFNWGEPFMHKGLLNFVRRFRDAGIKTQISSNLSVREFSNKELEEIVESGLTSIVASIDGLDQREYEAYRRNGDVKKAFGNLVRLKETRDRMGSKTPHLIWAFHMNRHNEGQVERAKQTAEAEGLTIWFKELSCPPEFQSSTVEWWPDLFKVPDNLAELWTGRGTSLIGPDDLDPRLPKTCNVCLMPFEIMVIFTNGDVYPCTATIGREFAVGNLIEESVETIWHEKMAVNRQQLLNTSTRVAGSQCYDCKHFPKSDVPQPITFEEA